MIGLSAILKYGTETSGNHGHSGIPGQVGGSSNEGGGGGEKFTAGKDYKESISNLTDVFKIKKFEILTDVSEQKTKEFVDAIGNRFQEVKNRAGDIFNKDLTKFKLETTMVNIRGEGIVGLYERSDKNIRVATAFLGGGGSNIYPLKTDNITGTAVHEYGHFIQANMSYELTNEFDKIYQKLDSKDIIHSVSNYASTNSRELFAESFKLYTKENYKIGSLPGKVEKFFDDLFKKNKKHLSENIQKQWKEYLHG